MKKLTIFFLVIIFSIPAVAQKQLEKTLSGYVNPEELVTISETTPFDKAMDVLSKVSEKLSGKKIVSTSGLVSPIGIEIDKMPYMKALLIIVQYNNLEYEEKENVIVVRKKFDVAKGLTEDVYASVDSREVKLSAIFFEADVAEMRSRGVNWEWLLSKNGFTIGSNLITFGQEAETEGTATTQKSPEFLINPAGEFDMGDFTGSADGVFKFFETENLGEIIAKPNVTVRDRMKGRIQIGEDVSIKQRDFAGNVIDIFVSTGTIIEVTPYVYNEDNVDYILLKVKVERSSAVPDVVSTVIKKTTAETDVLMLNDEETVIGGLFINQEVDVRRGIPFLRDLPWWVFGLRYLTGYDEKQVNKKEVIILLRAEIVPTLKERIAREKENLFEKQIEIDHKDGEKFRVKSFEELDPDKR